MKAWVKHEVICGLGMKSMVILPISSGAIYVSVPYTDDPVFFGHLTDSDEWAPNAPGPEDGFEEIILPDFLGNELMANYQGDERIARETSNHLRLLVLAHRNKLHKPAPQPQPSETEITVKRALDRGFFGGQGVFRTAKGDKL